MSHAAGSSAANCSASYYCVTPRILPEMSTEKLRRNLSQIINRAAYGMDPVLVTRRGLKMVAVISMDEEREDAGT